VITTTSKLAPIGISAYSRLGHLRNAIDALKRDPLAARSQIYLFSDGPAAGAEGRVAKVRAYLRQIDGFSKVHVIERAHNNRTFNNRDGMRQLSDEHGRFIWLEEDIVVAPGFLKFMNAALDCYADNSEIFSICGYRPPFSLPETYSDDAFVLPRFSAWGFATWKDRFDRIRMTIPRSEYYRFLLNPLRVARFARGGWDMLPMLHAEVHGRIDALDVKIFYQQFLMGMNTVYPVRHLASNTGNDGSGLHCVKTERFDVLLDNSIDQPFNLPATPVVRASILNANQQFRDIGLRAKARFWRRAVQDLFTYHRDRQ
jgi:hypothetical protein